jgi:hypothetical protein
MNKLHVARTNAADKLGVSARLNVVHVFFAAHADDAHCGIGITSAARRKRGNAE